MLEEQIERHFLTQDSKAYAAWRSTSKRQLVIPGFSIQITAKDVFANAVLLSFYLALAAVFVVGVIFLVVQLSTITVASLITLLVDLFQVFLLAFFLLTPCFFVAFLLGNRRVVRHTVPGFLFSFRFSQLEDFTLFVNENGIDGRFALPWSRVTDVAQRGPDILSIFYKRTPNWLSTMVEANKFEITFADQQHAAELMEMWQQYRHTTT